MDLREIVKIRRKPGAIVAVSIRPGPRLNVVEKCKCNRVNGVFPRNADFVRVETIVP